jgi:hypothetical protein
VESHFAVLGEGAMVLSTPSRPACPVESEGYRGFETWMDCSATMADDSDPEHQNFESSSTGYPATGMVPSSVGQKPSLAFTPDTPTTAPADQHERPVPDAKRLAAGAVLLGPDGSPMAGQILHFTLQRYVDVPGVSIYWSNEWQVEAVTDQQGLARAALPLSGWSNYPEGPWRINVSFDGGPGLYPRHTASPLTAAA